MAAFSDDATLGHAALQAAGDLGYCWDLVTNHIRWTHSAGSTEALLAQGILEQTAEAFQERIHGQDREHRARAVVQHYETGAPVDCEYRLRRADGGLCWVHERALAQIGGDGRPRYLLGVIRFVDQRKEREASLERQVNYDDLTGLFTRSRFRDGLQQIIDHVARYSGTGAYLSVGIDKLGMINEAYGPPCADAVIIATGQRLEQLMRTSDILGRVAGDTFGIGLSHCPQNDLPKVAERILNAFRDQPLQTPSGPMHITLSAGGVMLPKQVKTAVEALIRAESAMHDAKQAGRDCFIPSTDHEAHRVDYRRTVDTAEAVKRALREDRLVLAFQPIVDSDGFTPCYYEGLVRLKHPDGRIEPAAAFVDVVERMGLARALDRRVFELAMAELDAHPDLVLAINLSAISTIDRGWLRTAGAAFAQRPHLARRLIVEITETAAVTDLGEIVDFVAAVREYGCRVALDDFGAGYTSFGHLRRLAVDIVKIDRSFVFDIATNEGNRHFVRTIFDLAGNLGLETIAEGIETLQDAEVLQTLRIPRFQGYLFAQPTIDRPWLVNGGGVDPVVRSIGRGLSRPPRPRSDDQVMSSHPA